MIFGQQPCKSPQLNRNIYLNKNQSPVFSLCCSQVKKVQMKYDEVIYRNINIQKIIIQGRIISVDKSKSPRGMFMLDFKIQDSTGRCLISFYYSQQLQKLSNHLGQYVKIGANIKVGGLVYRPQLKIKGTSIVLIKDYNEITAHFLQIMKSIILTQS